MKKTIAIIGGGFSGVSVLQHLIHLSNHPLKICLFEKSSMLAKGVAFGTEEACHPLNVRADRMGAFAGKPDDFYKWLSCNNDLWGDQFPDLSIHKGAYLPRKLYGLYLKTRFKESVSLAQQKDIDVEVTSETVGRIDWINDTYLIQNQYKAHFCVLATGVAPAKRLKIETPQLLESARYIPNIWKNTPWNKILQSQCITIIGSGLTALDALASLASYEGKITIVTKSGTFPNVHEEYIPLRSSSKSFSEDYSCLGVFKKLRHVIKKLNEEKGNWREGIDSLRPHTQRIWGHFDLKNKKRFLRHLFSLWNRHRHRMSPTSELSLQRGIEKNNIQVIRGGVDGIEVTSNGLEVFSARKKWEADYVLNCSGPDYVTHSPLLKSLIAQKILEADALGLGLKIIEKEKLAGHNGGNFFALGSLLFGEKFETTAVPEIREQAASITQTILNELFSSHEIL